MSQPVVMVGQSDISLSYDKLWVAFLKYISSVDTTQIARDRQLVESTELTMCERSRSTNFCRDLVFAHR